MADGKRALLDDDDDDADESEKPQHLGYNEKYAERFTHNKKREDLHRLQELQKKGLAGRGLYDDDESSSSEEEDDDGLLPARTEEKIFETLSRIKQRDPIIYREDTKFFGEDDEGEDEDEIKSNAVKLKKEKPLYLKDVNSRQVLEGGEDDDDFREPKKPPTSYLTEQGELKKAFLHGVREAEGGGEESAEDDLLRVKKRTTEELEKEAKEVEEAVEEAGQRAKDKNIAKRLEEYFGKDDDLNVNDKFLKEYLLNKGWIDVDHKQSRYPTYHGDAEDISEDEEVLDKQDQFEKDYNFRFQDGVDNTYVKGHSRIIDHSVRKKSEARKKHREKRKERQLEGALARREELKRLKNVKMKEVYEKLAKIRAVAGVVIEGGGVDVLGADDLDEDFDPEGYDKKMREAFGEEYYGAEDPDFVYGDDEDVDEFEKPDFDAEDELLGVAPHGNEPSVGFAAVKAELERKKKRTVPVDPDSIDDDDEDVDKFDKPDFDAEDESLGFGHRGNEPSTGFVAAEPKLEPKKRKKALKVPFEEKLIFEKHLEEYYKLDYEDIVGDLPTRFKYRPVKPNKYGLKAKDIIGLDDKELNQYVSLKKLSPYTTEEWEPRRPAPRLSSKARRKKALNSDNTSKKKSKASISVDENVGNGGDTPKERSKVSIAVNDHVANSEDTPEKRKTSVILVDDDNSPETVLNGGKANSEPLPSENGARGEMPKKSRKRKKRGAPSPLPMSRLLSYAPQSGKKNVGGKSKKKKLKR